MIDVLVVLFLALISVMGLEKIKVRQVRNLLFLIAMIPFWYISMSIAIIIMHISGSVAVPLERWYIKLFIEWLFLYRTQIFPNESYPSFILGILIGFHITAIEVYVPKSPLLRKKEAQESISKIMCTVAGFYDGIFVGGVVGLIGIPIAILVYSLIDKAIMVSEKIFKARKLRDISDIIIHITKIFIVASLLALFASFLSIFIGAVCGINSPHFLESSIEDVSPYVRATIIGMVYGWLGGVGSIILSTIFSILGWIGYVRNIMPYWIVIGTQSVGKDIAGPVGATLGSIFGMFFGAILETMIRQWRYLKEKMRELTLKEKRARFKAIGPDTLRKIVELGAFDSKEAKENGIPVECLAALYGSGVIDYVGGKIYVVNMANLEKYISGFEEIRRNLGKIKGIPRIELSEKVNDYLCRAGIKNLILIIFDPRAGPTPICAVRYTKFSYKLFSDPTIPVTLSSISRTITEAKVHEAKLILRTYTTKYHRRDLYHVVCAEIAEELQKRYTYDVVADIADEMGIRECTDKEGFRKVIEHIVRARMRRE